MKNVIARTAVSRKNNDSFRLMLAVVGILFVEMVVAACRLQLDLCLSLSIALAFVMVAVGYGMDTIRSTFVRRLRPARRLFARLTRVLRAAELHHPLPSACASRPLAYRSALTILFFLRFICARSDEPPRRSPLSFC